LYHSVDEQFPSQQISSSELKVREGLAVGTKLN
jgi:hypothetical protein